MCTRTAAIFDDTDCRRSATGAYGVLMLVGWWLSVPYDWAGVTAGLTRMPHPKMPHAHPGCISLRKGGAAHGGSRTPASSGRDVFHMKIFICRHASAGSSFRLRVRVGGGPRWHHARNPD